MVVTATPTANSPLGTNLSDERVQNQVIIWLRRKSVGEASKWSAAMKNAITQKKSSNNQKASQ